MLSPTPAAMPLWRVAFVDGRYIDVRCCTVAEAVQRASFYGEMQSVSPVPETKPDADAKRAEAERVAAELEQYRAVYAQALDWCREQGVSPHCGIEVRDAYHEEDGMAVEACVSISAAAMHRLGLSRDNAVTDAGWREDRLHLRWQVAPRVEAWVILHAADLDGEAA